MKYIYRNVLYILLFLLASCSDEELVNSSRPKDGELTEMTFTLCIPQEERVTTRAAASESTVNELYLLVFKLDGTDGAPRTLVEHHKFDESTDASIYTDVSEKNENGEITKVKKRFKATLQASSEKRGIYIVANANSQLGTLLPENENENPNLTFENIKALTTDITLATLTGDDSTAGKPFVMSGETQSTIPNLNLVITDIDLIRSAAKITVETQNREDEEEDNGEDFRCEEFNLWNGATKGSILAGCADIIIESSKKSGETYPNAATPDSPLYTYPCTNTEESRLFVIVKGTYKEQTGYYRIDLKNSENGYLNIEPNHHYQIVIHRVKAPGYSSAQEAADHTPSGIEGEIYDIEPDIHSMITDGNFELGVTDRVEIHSGETSNTETETENKKEFTVKVYQYGKSATDLKSSIYLTANAHEDIDWLKNITPLSTEGVDNPLVKTDEENNQEYLLYTYTFDADENLSGGTREGTIDVTATVDGLSLTREVIVVQTADFLGYKFIDAKLTAKYSTDTETKTLIEDADYWDFLLDPNNENHSTPNKILYGITKTDMGGEVRNAGFHFPVNDRMQFIYTITLPNAAGYDDVEWEVKVDERFSNKLLFEHPNKGNGGEITITNGQPPTGMGMKGQSFTFATNYATSTTANGTDVAQNYRFGKEAFQFILTTTEGKKTIISYDLYHTGIFQYIDDDETNQTNNIIGYAVADKPKVGWYYYEVIPMGGR